MGNSIPETHHMKSSRRIEKKCPDCGAKMRFGPVEQEFEKGGIRVVVSGMSGWSCPKCHAVLYPPGVMDHIVKSAQELHRAANAGGARFASARAKTKGKARPVPKISP
jgi:YgiT-type zinc finger domain-containing protein